MTNLINASAVRAQTSPKITQLILQAAQMPPPSTQCARVSHVALIRPPTHPLASLHCRYEPLSHLTTHGTLPTVTVGALRRIHPESETKSTVRGQEIICPADSAINRKASD